MFEEIYSEILGKVEFTAIDKFEALIRKSISRAVINGEDNPNIVSVSFKWSDLLDGLFYFANINGKESAPEDGAKVLLVILEALQYEYDVEDTFILFQLTRLGKFRKREADLLSDLKALWIKNPDYEMSDRDFSRALKVFMRDKFINYRKGNLTLNPSFIIRYRV